MAALDLCCGLCGLDIPLDEARVAATCCKCATASYHLSCTEEYVQRNFSTGITNSKTRAKAQVRLPAACTPRRRRRCRSPPALPRPSPAPRSNPRG
jgi:hypothetical protein